MASPDCSPGRSRSATPAKPTSTAPIPARETRSPEPRRIRITHSGTEAISRAATLEGTSCSATVTTALAPGSRMPTSSALSSWARVGRTERRSERTPTITAPATAKRVPAPSRGGTVSTITRMAR